MEKNFCTESAIFSEKGKKEKQHEKVEMEK